MACEPVDRVQYFDHPGLAVTAVNVDGVFWGLVVANHDGPWAGEYELHRWCGHTFNLLAQSRKLKTLDDVIRTEVGC